MKTTNKYYLLSEWLKIQIKSSLFKSTNKWLKNYSFEYIYDDFGYVIGEFLLYKGKLLSNRHILKCVKKILKSQGYYYLIIKYTLKNKKWIIEGFKKSEKQMYLARIKEINNL